MLQPHLLLIAFFFPPSRASGVYRALHLANNVAGRGWDVTVITTQCEFFSESLGSVDPSLEGQIADGVDVERVHFEGRPWDRNLRRWGWWRANFPKIANSLAEKRAKVLFPEVYAPWIPGVVKRGRAVHARHPIDVIVATGNPFSSFAAADLLSIAVCRPYALDYRDSWTLNLYDGTDAFPPRHRAWRWEKRFMRRASLVTHVNEPIRTWYADRYPESSDKFLLMENGYDPDLLEGVDLDSGSQVRERLRFGFVGTITDKLPLAPFFDAWRSFRSASPDPVVMEFHGYLGYFPGSVSAVAVLLPTNEADTNVSYEGPVEKQRIGETYGALDVLVLLTASSPYVTSGKVYEYMATGKPIVCVNEPGSGARVPLEGYPRVSFVDSLEPEAIRRALESAAWDAAERDASRVEAARRYAQRFERRKQTETFEHRLRCLVGG